MEKEYKWEMKNESEMDSIIHSKLLSQYILNNETIDMEAIYFDSKEGLMKKNHGALRIRKQNQQNICCLKLEEKSDSNLKVRQEYEIEENNLQEALKKLPAMGASKELCNVLMQEQLIELCKMKFERKSYHLSITNQDKKCDVELSFDVGQFMKKEKSSDFMEIELELKNGDEDVFNEYAQIIESEFCLKPQPLSKIARAMKL